MNTAGDPEMTGARVGLTANVEKASPLDTALETSGIVSRH